MRPALFRSRGALCRAGGWLRQAGCWPRRVTRPVLGGGSGCTVEERDTSAFDWGNLQYRFFEQACDLGKCGLHECRYSGMCRLNADVSMVWQDGWRGRRIRGLIGPQSCLNGPWSRHFRGMVGCGPGRVVGCGFGFGAGARASHFGDSRVRGSGCAYLGVQ